MNRIATAIFAASLLLGAQAYAGSTTFAYAPKDATPELCGTGKHETYDIAIALTHPTLAGMKITSIEVPMQPSARVSGVSAWVASQLRLELVDERHVNAVDKRWELDLPAQGEMQFLRVDLDEPYVIPEGGLYVGYSFTVDEMDRSEATMVPVVATLGQKEGGFFLHTSRSYLNWQDRSIELGVVALTQVELEGDMMANAAMLGDIATVYAEIGKPLQMQAPVVNIGLNPISSVDYSLMLDNGDYEGTVNFDPPIPAVFAASEQISIAIDPFEEGGHHEGILNITKVNGERNDYSRHEHVIFEAYKFVPKHLALVEEFTGTWCGWCPRGFVAMELMAEMYPDFVGIAYHDSDPMAMADGYPNITSGKPSANVNRVFSTDPFYASPKASGFSMPQVWEEYCSGFVPVGISVEAEWNDGIVEAVSHVEWVAQPDEADGTEYRVEYVLVGDDLHSPAVAWRQKNYYCTEPMEEYMEFFCNAGEYVYDLHFNDVALLTSGMRGVEGSVESCEVGYDNAFTYAFDTSQALNINGNEIPFDKEKLRVIAFLLACDDAYGKVVNATKCDVALGNSIAAVATDPAAQPAYYDLQGRPIAHPRGLVIEVTPQGARKVLK